jgi:hypothetical protein
MKQKETVRGCGLDSSGPVEGLVAGFNDQFVDLLSVPEESWCYLRFANFFEHGMDNGTVT